MAANGPATPRAPRRSDDSDALSTLAALVAFEAAGASDAFCRDAFLHARHLREMADLRKQLARTLRQVCVLLGQRCRTA
jgi:ATP-dependent RNA helicase DHX37/DHR1